MTTETKFTPGPWTYSQTPFGFPLVQRGHSGGFVVESFSLETAEADAALIAAAPDLYAALRRAETKLAAYVGVCKDDKELTGTVLPMAQAALAKARGEA